MKYLAKRIIILTAIILLVLSSFSYAQQLRPRDIFLKKTDEGSPVADAARVVVLLKQGTSFLPVSPNHIFKAGDEFKLEFEANFDGYMYVVNIGTSGKNTVIFPQPKLNNRVKLGDIVRFPRQDVFEVANPPGIDVLQVLIAPQPIENLESAIKNSNGQLGASAKDVVSELKGDESIKSYALKIEDGGKSKKESKLNGIIANNLGVASSSIRTRNIELEVGDDGDKEGSFVAVPDGTLNNGEAIVFELRFEHR